MSADGLEIRDIERDERAQLARVTAYRPDVGQITLTVMLVLVDSGALENAVRAALESKKRTIDILSAQE